MIILKVPLAVPAGRTLRQVGWRREAGKRDGSCHGGDAELPLGVNRVPETVGSRREEAVEEMALLAANLVVPVGTNVVGLIAEALQMVVPMTAHGDEGAVAGVISLHSSQRRTSR